MQRVTTEELAAAHGQRFSAQDLIDQAKKTAADLTGQAARTGATWKRPWRDQRRQWRAVRVLARLRGRWAGVLILFVLFQIVTGPLRVARYGTYDAWGRPHPVLAIWDSLLGTALVVLAICILYRHMPPTHDFREFMQNLPDAVRAVAGEIARWFRGATTS